MGLKDIAVKAAEEQTRHAAQEAQLKREKARLDLTTEARAWLVGTFVQPDEFFVPDGPGGYNVSTGYVRWEDLWFKVERYVPREGDTRNQPFMLRPTEPCPTTEGEWHLVDISLQGGVTDHGLQTLEAVGAYIKRGEEHPQTVHVRCFRCERLLGDRSRPDGARYFSGRQGLGDLAELAKQAGVCSEIAATRLQKELT